MAPKGYEPVKQGKDVDLDGKEVYLAQIPADFDIKKAVIKSDTEITSNGTPYFMMASTPLSNCDILTASKDGSLKPSATKLRGLLAFTQQVPKNKVDYEKEISEKPLVPQKENITMKHFATGYGPESIGVGKKHKRDDDGAPTPEKKHKKEKKEKKEKKKKEKKEKK